MVVLRADPACDELYHGIFKQATIFIVGYDTDAERLFVRGERTAALKYARENKLSFDQVVARSCCHHLTISLLGN